MPPLQESLLQAFQTATKLPGTAKARAKPDRSTHVFQLRGLYIHITLRLTTTTQILYYVHTMHIIRILYSICICYYVKCINRKYSNTKYRHTGLLYYIYIIQKYYICYLYKLTLHIYCILYTIVYLYIYTSLCSCFYINVLFT